MWQYFCSLQNNVYLTICGIQSCSWLNVQFYHWLILLDKPEGTTLTTSAADNTITQDDTVTFTCQVTAAKPQVSRYIFSLNDTTIVKDSNGSQYTINNVQRSQHYGNYKCLPSNDVGDGPEASVILNVNGEYDHCLLYDFCGFSFSLVNRYSTFVSSWSNLWGFLISCFFSCNPAGERWWGVIVNSCAVWLPTCIFNATVCVRCIFL